MDALLVVVFLVAFVIFMWAMDAYKRHVKHARKVIVNEGIVYPNNHHALGVGYYHAAAGQWFVHPWNEYREDRGYYWEGEWHVQPDARQVYASIPSAAEVRRVNETWRKAGPDEMAIFWGRVERNGFGTARTRQEGS